MIEHVLILLMPSLFWMLRVSPGGSFPKALSKVEEQEYLRRLAEGDLEARNQLVEHNLRLVAHIVKKYYAQTEEVDDLISIGTIGLIKGVNTFKPEKGVKLSSYVSRCIENELLMNFRGKRKSAGDVSLSEALDAEEEGGNLSYQDVLTCPDDLAEQIGRREEKRKLRALVGEALTPREGEIIQMRYGLDGKAPLTQKQTAEHFGISRSYVSRIEKKALEKLRNALGEEISGA